MSDTIPPAVLDRRAPESWEHVEKYPLRGIVDLKPTPVILGINWYSAFDDPELETTSVGGSARRAWASFAAATASA